MYGLLDIGGTNMRIAAANAGSPFEEPLIVPTPQSFEEGVSAIRRGLGEVLRGRRLKGVVAGVPGPLNKAHTELRAAPNLTGWVERPLRQRLEQDLHSSVQLENDAALVGLGEAHFGAGRGHTVVAYITVSTGVGGTRIVRGRLDAAVTGFEPGHQLIDVDRTMCPRCKSGELEHMVSGHNLQLRTGTKPSEITDPALWDEMARYLAAGIANTIVHWTPDAVVLGGSMVVRRPGIDIEAVRRHLGTFLTIYEPPVLKQAELGALGGLYGALALVNQAAGSRNAIEAVPS